MTLELAAKEILMLLGRAFSQVNLYGTNHPIVTQSINESTKMLTDILDNDIHEEIVFFLDHERLLVNGRFLGNLKEQGVGIRTLFQKFNLHSIAFLRGLMADEMTGFCRLLRENIPDPKEFKIDEWLTQNQIIHIRANEAFYAKVEKNEDNLVQETGQGTSDKTGDLADLQSPAQGQSQARESDTPNDDPLRAILNRIASSIGLDNDKGPTGGDKGNDGEGRPNSLAHEKIEYALEDMRGEFSKMVNEASKVLLAEITRLQNEIKRLENLLTKTFNGFMTIDGDGRIRGVDATCELLLGQKQEKLSGQLLGEVLEPASHFLALAKDLGTLPIKPISPAISAKANPEIIDTIGNSAILVFSENNRIVGYVAVAHDLAKIKEYEDYKTNLLSRIITTFNKPTQALVQILDQFKSFGTKNLSSEQQQLLEHLGEQKNQLTRSLKALTDFSLINANQLRIFNVAFSIYSAVSDASDSMIPWAKSLNLSISIEAEKNLPLVQGDPKRTTEIIRHLLSNAIKNSTPRNQIIIRTARGTMDMESQIIVSIRDQGKGLPKGEIEKFYREFSVVQNNEETSGLGLGLTLCKSLTELQKGRFWGQTNPGSGSEFCFTLPITTAPKEFKPELIAAPKKEQKLSWWKKFLRLFGINIS